MAEIWRLDDMKIKALKGPEPGKKVLRLNDGGGLFLRVTKHTDKKGVERVSKSWEFFFTINNKTSCTGLGPYAPAAKAPGLTLEAARDKAHELRKLKEAGINPVEDKKKKEAERIAAKAEAERLLLVEAARAKTFAAAVEDYLEIKDAELTNDRHRQTWRSSLYTYALPIIGEIHVAEITMQDVLRVLNQSFEDKSGKVIGTLFEARNETALRLRNRISEAFDDYCVDMKNENADDGAKELWTRTALKSLKLAALLAVADNSINPVITLAHIEWAKRFELFGVESTLRRFEDGEAGEVNEDARVKAIVKYIKRYVMSSWPEIAKVAGEGNSHLHREYIVTYTYLHRSVANLKPFKEVRYGSPANALKDALKILTERGELSELSKAVMAKDHEYYGVAFAIRKPGAFGI